MIRRIRAWGDDHPTLIFTIMLVITFANFVALALAIMNDEWYLSAVTVFFALIIVGLLVNETESRREREGETLFSDDDPT